MIFHDNLCSFCKDENSQKFYNKSCIFSAFSIDIMRTLSVCPPIWLVLIRRMAVFARLWLKLSFVDFLGLKLDQILYTLRDRNWTKFCTLLGLETGPNFVHSKGWKLDQALYIFGDGNWTKLSSLLGVETGPSFVHF
jgi:hypothetical protein